MTTIRTHEETTHESILETSEIDDTVLTDKVSCICIMFNVTNGRFVMFVIETWLIWCTAGPYRITKMVRGAEELALLACWIDKKKFVHTLRMRKLQVFEGSLQASRPKANQL